MEIYNIGERFESAYTYYLCRWFFTITFSLIFPYWCYIEIMQALCPSQRNLKYYYYYSFFMIHDLFFLLCW